MGDDCNRHLHRSGTMTLARTLPVIYILCGRLDKMRTTSFHHTFFLARCAFITVMLLYNLGFLGSRNEMCSLDILLFFTFCYVSTGFNYAISNPFIKFN